MRGALGLILATGAAAGPQWLLTSQYRPGASSGCGATGPVATWTARVTFGACIYEGKDLYAILTLTSDGQSVSVQKYSDSSCTKTSGSPTSMTLSVLGIKLGCSSAYFGGLNVETFASLAPAQYISKSPYGLPIAPFAGVGYFFSTSPTCSDFSSVTEISLSNAGQGSGFCYYPGSSTPGDASYTISCADPASPSLILFPLPNCGGTGFPMTPNNYPNYQAVLANIRNPPCKLKFGAYLQQVFCYDTAVSTPSRMQYPTPAPTPPPHPTAPPTKLPTAVPTPTPAPTQTVRLTDKAALCALYNSFDAAKRTALLGSWTCSSSSPSALACTSSSSTSTWVGVTCTRGRVTSVTLLGLKLGSGSLPQSIGTMDGLTSLTLSGLGLSGYLPAQLGLLTSLVTLSASANSLSGWLPSTLGLLRNLKTLDLHSNSFDGSLPTTLGALSQLTSLDLGNCKIAGAVPSYLGAMTNLRVLNLGGNRLAGTVPSSVCSLTKTSVSVSANLGIPCYPACLASRSDFSHDSKQVQCSPPTSAPTLRVITAAPTPTPTAMLGQSASSSSAGQDGEGSGVSTGAIVGISVALAVLCVAAVFVYRAVKRSELDLPTDKDDQNLSLARNPMEGSARGGYGRNDSIPPPSEVRGRSGGTSLSVGVGGGGRWRDTIPVGDAYSAKYGGGRLDPNQL